MSDGDLRAASEDTARPLAPPPGTRLRTLGGLAAYRCGHTGSCCRAGWPIPVEAAPLALLRQAATRAALPLTAMPEWLSGGDILGRTPDSRCVFLNETALTSSSGGCRIETALGHEALPLSCRQFPRILLVDGRGWHLTLSTWCGTAAGMVTCPVAGATDFLSYDHISADPRVHLEFLDARDAWPPLLRPGVLAGLGAYDAWEARVLEDFLRPVADGQRDLSEAMLDLVRWTEWVRDWRRADGALEVRVMGRWRVNRGQLGRDRSEHVDNLCNDLIDAVPSLWRPAAWPSGLTDASYSGPPISRHDAGAALARYVATRLVGTWVAYQGEGLRSVVASLVAAYALAVEALRRTSDAPPTIGHLTSAIRAADWLILHLLDRSDWARWCAKIEAGVDAAGLAGLVQEAGASLDALPWAGRARCPNAPDSSDATS
jgi:hypothetical protein